MISHNYTINLINYGFYLSSKLSSPFTVLNWENIDIKLNILNCVYLDEFSLFYDSNWTYYYLLYILSDPYILHFIKFYIPIYLNICIINIKPEYFIYYFIKSIFFINSELNIFNNYNKRWKASTYFIFLELFFDFCNISITFLIVPKVN